MRANIQQISDTAVRVQFGSSVDSVPLYAPAYILHEFVKRLEKNFVNGITYWEFAYTTVTVHFEPWRISGSDLLMRLRELSRNIPVETTVQTGRILEIPVCYGDEYGPDLADVAEYHKISQEEVIEKHSSVDYSVAFIGFLPGFPYLTGLSDALATPRLTTPRQKVPAGSVGIGGQQTGIYPNESPAGWRIIGRTPIKLFDQKREPPTLCRAGDTIRFVPITREQFTQP